jgi:DNA mismatch repair protein MutS
VRREVTEIVTPGTAIDESLLSEGRNNFVAALSLAGDGDRVGVASVDLSTGEFEVRECRTTALQDELTRLEPTEIVVPFDAGLRCDGPWLTTEREPWRFEPDMAGETLARHFGLHSVEGFDLAADSDRHLLGAAGAVVSYVEEVRPAGVSHLRTPRVERAGRYMHLDEMTRRNLEIVESLRGSSGGTLLEVLDRTRTPMGRRMLRRRLLEPLLDLDEIALRHEVVEELVERSELRSEIRSLLREVRDVERLASRISGGRILPRELLALASSLAVLPPLQDAIRDAASRLSHLAALDTLDDVRELIDSAVDPEAPASLSAGGVIRPGHAARLDEQRSIRDGAVEWIAGLQASERASTGIESLKIGFNKVFGYYIEVTRSNLSKVPETYQRKQTLTNAERYVTPELKEWEAKVFGADEQIAVLEQEAFRDLRDAVATEVGRLLDSAQRVAELDVYAGLAEVAVRNDYVRPAMTRAFAFEIRDGRHPVVERMISREDFIPNDVVLDDSMSFMVLTGPNMSGKSTILRQVGLTALLAQVGSFVPASAARLGICDRIFTRVGASDDLSRGQSTFMVEMVETATILSGATDRSLVLLDEIGRGTSTYDGVAIAWAVTEYIHDVIGAKTVFATHYHELVELADQLDGVGAFNVAVRETGDDIVFLRRLEPGGCDRSYGVQVARLAGVPRPVIDRAFEVLHELEDGSGGGSRLSHLGDRSREQLSLFEPRTSRILERMADLDPERMTPLESILALAELKRLAEEDA